MFGFCTQLTSLDISNWNLPYLQEMKTHGSYVHQMNAKRMDIKTSPCGANERSPASLDLFSRATGLFLLSRYTYGGGLGETVSEKGKDKIEMYTVLC